MKKYFIGLFALIAFSNLSIASSSDLSLEQFLPSDNYLAKQSKQQITNYFDDNFMFQGSIISSDVEAQKKIILIFQRELVIDHDIKRENIKMTFICQDFENLEELKCEIPLEVTVSYWTEHIPIPGQSSSGGG